MVRGSCRVSPEVPRNYQVEGPSKLCEAWWRPRKPANSKDESPKCVKGLEDGMGLHYGPRRQRRHRGSFCSAYSIDGCLNPSSLRRSDSQMLGPVYISRHTWISNAGASRSPCPPEQLCSLILFLVEYTREV